MRVLGVFQKSLIETMRDWRIIMLTLLLAPVFVVALYGFFGSTSEYKIIVCNRDQNADGLTNHGAALVTELKNFNYVDASIRFQITETQDLAAAKGWIQNNNGQAIILIPEDFSRTIAEFEAKRPADHTNVTLLGDVTNVNYIIAAVFLEDIVNSYVDKTIGVEKPVYITEEIVGVAGAKTSFDLMVPGLLVFAIAMVIFTAAIAFIKEVQNGTIRRLQISTLRPYEFLGAVSLMQLIISFAGIVLTLLAAAALGFEVQGSTASLVVVGVMSSISIIAIGLITAAFSRNIYDVMIIGNFPFFLIMFLSGVMFPVPDSKLFTIANHAVGFADFLSTTQTVVAFNKILNFGATLNDLVFELSAISLLMLIYFLFGAWVFNRRHISSS